MKYFTLFLLLIFVQITNAQPNLVPNPSFEKYKRCLTFSDDIIIDSSDNVNNWFIIEPIIEGRVWGDGRGMPGWAGAASGGAYFNRCSNKTWRDSLYEGLPQNLSGYQETKTGDGYI